MRSNPFYRALNTQETVGGAEKSYAVLIFTMGLATLYATHYLPFAAFFIAMFFLLRWLTKKDPFIRRAYIKYNIQSDRWDPWPSRKLRNKWRPDGFNRGVRC